jgi:hypothetical protein
MKRFIITNLLTAIATVMMACAWEDTHNYYLFSVYEQQEFSTRCYDLTMQNWRSYLGSDIDFSYYDADVILAEARRRGDKLMESYVRQLERYMKIAQEVQQDRWDYPTKAQLASRKAQLLAIKSYALGKLKTRLRSQHALLYMRCNMMLGLHSENVRFWEQTASRYIDTVYKEMMKNIYAGALLHTGQNDRAGMMFAEMGDWESLMTQYYDRRSCAAIRAEYERDANSSVLPFLLQDYVNNAQEAVDAANQEWYREGKLYVRNIQESEAMQMCELARQVVSQGKTRSPQMWQSAKAWLEFLFGRQQQAKADIDVACQLAGTPRMNDNARVLRLYINSVLSPIEELIGDYLPTELSWLLGRVDEFGFYSHDHFYMNALDRTVIQVLADKFTKAGCYEEAAALYQCNILSSEYYNAYIDTLSVDRLQTFINYAHSKPETALDSVLIPRLSIDDEMLNDLVGTKYMRLGRWDEALAWLDKVPLNYYKEKGYAPYAALRTWTVEPWLKRQWLTEAEAYGEEKVSLSANPKSLFAREMLRMESALTLLEGESRCLQCYDLAVRYAQAHFTGDCWYLMRDGKSVMDTVRVNEIDLGARALSLLTETARSTKADIRERALFAQCYAGLYDESNRWCAWDWDSKVMDMVRLVDPLSDQYKAFLKLADFEAQNQLAPSSYVSRCDEFRQFRKIHQ